MGIMTLAQFQDDLAQALGRTLDATRTIRWINNCMYEFGYAFKFPELAKVGTIPTVAGTRSYSMPSDFRALGEDGVRLISPQDRFGGILKAETRTNYLRGDRWPETSAYGQTRWYHMFQKKIWIRPGPDSTVESIEFDYWSRITPMSGANDVSIFNEEWDDVIFRGALLRGHLAYGEHDRLINVYNLYLSLVRSRVMAEDLQEFPEGGISLIESAYANEVHYAR